MGKVEVVAIVSLWVIPISILVNRIVPDPYMDEIFHVPQAQQYCRGNFRSWDPMITTPPGLYLLSLAHAAALYPGSVLLHVTPSFFDLCSTAMLRSINGVLAVVCSILIYEILMKLRPALDHRKATLCTVVLVIYPLHWFFSFLYYTDVASLAAVLSMYLACLKKNYWLSALLGAVAVIIRQTNIIWMLFVACIGVMNIIPPPRSNNIILTDIDEPMTGKAEKVSRDRPVVNQTLRMRKSKNAGDTVIRSADAAVAPSTLNEGLLDEIMYIVITSWHKKWELLVLFCPFVMVLVAFVAFIKWNGSIVLGAKDAHKVSPHFAQIMYYALVSVLAMAPVHFAWSRAAGLLHSFWKRRPVSFIQFSLGLAAGFVSVHFFSIAHPYLLADNRHYPFYLWRKIIMAHPLVKYLLVPLYTYSWFSIINLLGKTQRRVWILVYFLATTATLVPAPLIEFRYYTIPFYLLTLHCQITDHRSWLLMGVLYAAVNVFTMVMFLFHPFKWDHEPGIQRFIW